jgi:hypothetical protein
VVRSYAVDGEAADTNDDTATAARPLSTLVHAVRGDGIRRSRLLPLSSQLPSS